MRFVIPALALLLANPALAINEQTTIILSGNPFFAECGGHAIDCQYSMPVIDVTGFQIPSIYVFIRNYDEVSEVQCAFDAPEWEFIFGTFYACQAGQVTGLAPLAPLGSVHGALHTVFNTIAGGTTAVLGTLNFYQPPSGCITVIDPQLPGGTYVNTYGGDPTPIPPRNRGRVCVGPGGYDACDPATPTPVVGATWGRIKGQYR